MEASPADHLRVVVSFRQRGVPSSDVHALLPKLLRDVRAIGFQVPLIDVPTFDVPAIDREVSATDQRLLQPTTCGTAATITLSCEHFLLDVSLNAAASLAGAVGELSLQHCSQTAPAWPHAQPPALECELQARLRLGDVAGFCRLLGALRSFQAVLSHGGSGKPERQLFGSAPTDWTDAREALTALLGSPPECATTRPPAPPHPTFASPVRDGAPV